MVTRKQIEAEAGFVGRLIRENEMRAALELCDRYFTALAQAWAKHGGQLVDKDGKPFVTDTGLGLAKLCDQAGEAVARVLHPEKFEVNR
jgi:hypothetical protein